MPDLQQYFIYSIPVNRRLLSRWFQAMDKSKNHYYVIEMHGRVPQDDGNTDTSTIPVGIVSVSRIDDARTSGIVGIYIAYEHLRGKGIAQIALNEIHRRYFYERGFQQLEACIHDHNTRSQKFFAKMGYKNREVTPTHHLYQTFQRHCLGLAVLQQNTWKEHNKT